jgi:glycosyltransferase involved in cell wall biosynthesis
VGYGVKRDHITVVEPGTDRAPLARGSQGTHLHLLSVATLNPGKGHEILFRALATVPHHNWRLTCAGSTERHPATSERLSAVLRALDMENRVTLVGEVDDAALAACYDGADLFVLATLHETFGMAVAEAIAHGLAVVSTATGAIVDLVGPGNDAAGILVPPGDVKSLADALSLVLADSRLREQLAQGARQARERLRPWDASFTRMSAALQRVAIDG